MDRSISIHLSMKLRDLLLSLPGHGELGSWGSEEDDL